MIKGLISLPPEKLATVAKFSGGAALLVAIAVLLGGNQQLSPTVQVALSAAVDCSSGDNACSQETLPSPGTKVVYLTTGVSSPWTVPADWNSAKNKIEVIGGGGGGSSSNTFGSGGGGGAYAKIENLSLTPGTSVVFQVGAGGTGGGTNGGIGGDTFFKRNSGTATTCNSSAMTLCAKGGSGASGSTAGNGGSDTSSVANGTSPLKIKGGNGGTGNNSSDTGGGGGGAGAPGGAGKKGANSLGMSTQDLPPKPGGGGGGAGGALSTDGGLGGLNGAYGGHGPQGIGGGGVDDPSGGTGRSGYNGGGGSGGFLNSVDGGPGGPGIEWDYAHGSGGGGGGGGDGTKGGIGALYGGGGGGGEMGGGAGGTGIIRITYQVAAPNLSLTAADASLNPGESTSITWNATGLGLPANGDCLGKDTTNACGTTYQDLNGISNLDSEVVSISDETFSATTRGTNGTVAIQKWQTSGNGCPAGGGFGNGTTCGSFLQEIYNLTSSSYASNDVEFVTIGSDVYLGSAQHFNPKRLNLFKWQTSGTGCPTGGGFGDGTKCDGTPYQSITGITPSTVKFFAHGANTYAMVSGLLNGSTQSSMIYKWQSSGSGCPTGGGFGNGTTCGAALPSTVAHAGLWSFFGTGENTYAIVIYSAGVARVYRWQSSECFGNGTTCGSAYQTITLNNITNNPNSTWGSFETFSIDGNLYVAAAEGPGNPPWPEPPISSSIYKWQSSGSGCPTGGGFGNGTTCGVAYQDVIRTESGRSWEFFTVGTNKYLAFAGGNTTSNAQLQSIFKWQPSGTGCPTGGGFGNGTTCGVSLQNATLITPASSDTTHEWTSFAIGSKTFLVATNNGTGVLNSPVYAFVEPSLCSVSVTDPNGGVTQLASGNSNPSGLSTGVLTEGGTYTYTLNCEGQGSVSVDVRVGATPTISVNTVQTGNAAEPSTGGYFTIVADQPKTTSYGINYVLSGLAVAGTDYTNPGTVIMPANQTQVIVPIAPLSDAIYEGTESVVLTLTSTGLDASYVLGPTVSHTLNLVDSQSAAYTPPQTFDACIGTAGGSCELAASFARVRKGNSVTVSWNVAGLVTGANGLTGNTCQIASRPALSGLPQTWNQTGSTWVGSISIPIDQQTIFTLTCTAPDGTTTKSVPYPVGLVPSPQEI